MASCWTSTQRFQVTNEWKAEPEMTRGGEQSTRRLEQLRVCWPWLLTAETPSGCRTSIAPPFRRCPHEASALQHVVKGRTQKHATNHPKVAAKSDFGVLRKRSRNTLAVAFWAELRISSTIDSTSETMWVSSVASLRNVARDAHNVRVCTIPWSPTGVV